MRIAILTNEYPPHVYGGAGVHVEYLTRELASADGGRHHVSVICFGGQDIRDGNLTVRGINPAFELPCQDPRHKMFQETMLRDLVMAGMLECMDIVHCHTWYTHLAGCLAKQLTGGEPCPDNALTGTPPPLEGRAARFRVSSEFVDRAHRLRERRRRHRRSGAMREDVHSLYGVPYDRVRIVHNGIDLSEYKPTPNQAVLTKHGIDPEKPFVLFVGRITRQKGIIHLVDAVKYIRPGVQVVLCAGAPDTKEIGREMEERVEQARRDAAVPINWIPQMLPREEIIPLYTHASVFVCPSVYEPFGIINLEAMACETPVVASAVGESKGGDPRGDRIAGVVRGGQPLELRAKKNPAQFVHDLSAGVNQLLDDPERRRKGFGPPVARPSRTAFSLVEHCEAHA